MDFASKVGFGMIVEDEDGFLFLFLRGIGLEVDEIVEEIVLYAEAIKKRAASE